MATKRIGINRDSQNLRNIKYVSRDFPSLRNDLINYFAKYFPDSGSDFTMGSGAIALIDIVSYASDILNFYVDKVFNENFLDRVLETRNSYDLAKGLGYQPRPITPSVATINLTFTIPVTGSLTSQFYFNITKGTRFSVPSARDIIFENTSPIIFNSETQNQFSSQIVTINGGTQGTQFSTTSVNVISGITKSFTKNFDNSDGFKKMHISDRSGINSVLEVIDSDGNQWYEVKNLSQEFIFTGIPNINDTTNSNIPFLLTLKRVPRRFVVTYNQDGTADLSFGFGDIDLSDTEFILSPENFVFPNKTIGKYLDFSSESIQLNDFLNTTSLGISPKNTTLSVLYRAGGGTRHNIGKNLITKVENVDIEFYSLLLTSIARQFVLDSLSVTNPDISQGGAEAETILETKTNASYWYASQDRVVTIEDYIARASSMPANYGAIYKIVAQQQKNQSFENIKLLTDKVDLLINQRSQSIDDNTLKQQIQQINTSLKNNTADITLHIISQDANGRLQKSPTILKNNLLTYLNHFKIMSDQIAIDDIKILNLGLRFEIHTDAMLYNPGEVLLNTMQYLRDILSIDNMEVGKNINIDELKSNIILNIKGVISIPEFNFFTIHETVDNRQYSNDFLNPIDDFLNYNGTIIEFDSLTMPEIKYLSSDIIGRYSENG
jgi:hypothetical protein